MEERRVRVGREGLERRNRERRRKSKGLQVRERG